MVGYWPLSFLRVYKTGLSSVWVHKHTLKKEFGQYPVILTSRLVNE